jgi:hypothetical protein
MIALAMFSLISLSSKTYTPLFEKSETDQDLASAPISDWKWQETYKCPMKYGEQTLVITSSKEITIVEPRTKD